MSEEKTVEERVKEVIETIRPYIQADGGDIEYVNMNGKIVNVRLQGACRGCPGAQMTLKMGVQQRLQEVIPEIEAVEAVP
jgi:Fe-S cluster biogenesis protein NfuA